MTGVPPDIAAQAPILYIVLVFVVVAFGGLLAGGGAFVRWLLDWSAKREETYLTRIEAMDKVRDEQNQKRDEVLSTLVASVREMGSELKEVRDAIKGAGRIR